MNGNLPWEFVFLGACITIIFELLQLPVLAIAIGVYLPLELDAAMMIGGVLRAFIDRRNKNAGKENSGGILFSSGLIAGEGIVGILLAVITVAGGAGAIDLSKWNTGALGGIAVLAILCALIAKSALPAKNEKKQ